MSRGRRRTRVSAASGCEGGSRESASTQRWRSCLRAWCTPNRPSSSHSSDHAAFGVLQSRPHEIWARFFASSLEDRLRYTPSDCFETFPFPDGWETHRGLEDAGSRYHDFRAALMARRGEGLTKTYNRFHDQHEDDAEVARLRQLHAAMDRAVPDVYGWTDIPIDCEFLLDHAIHEEAAGNRKKPYRYRWPDRVRDEVLARLLELNAERAVEQARARRVAARAGADRSSA